jgi:adenylate cyclase
VSWTTDRAGGFTDLDIWFLADLVPLLALRLEIEAARFEAGVLLATYLGAEAARRVLAGDIRRGEGRTIRAALWYSDLRGFTALADRSNVIAVLNRYFECAVGAVEAEGGEILKFIGDAVLAIFPADADAGTACAAALRAAYDADRRLAVENESRRTAGQAALAQTVALHLGDVTFGNIGGPDRLDFTVIGAAVNELARLEELAPALGDTIVASGSFAAACPCPLLARGRHRLRGVADPIEVFAAAR